MFFFLGFSGAASYSTFVAYKLLIVQGKMFLVAAIVNSDKW